PHWLWCWSRLRPVLAGLAAALSLSLVGGLAGMTFLWPLAEGHRRQAEGNAPTADRRRQEAQAAQERAAANLYFSRLAPTRLAWRLNDVTQMRQLLDQCIPQAGEADLRGWEWHYLSALTADGLVTIPTGQHQVECVAFSRDGQRPGEVRVWDLTRQPEFLTA